MLRLAKCGGRLRIVEVVQIEHATNERGVRIRRRRGSEGERAQPRRLERHLVVHAAGVGAFLGGK